MDLLTPVGKDTLSERVYERLAKAIMTGEFMPGTAITLTGIADRLNTSAMPVREAVRRLASQHALILSPNTSIEVPVLSAAEFEQLWQLRKLLEGEASALAAVHHGDCAIAALARLVEETNAAADASDLRQIIIKSHEFFFQLYASSGNAILVSMIQMLWLRTGPFYYEPTSSERHLPFVRRSLRNNGKLLRAVKSREAATARKIRVEDLDKLSEWLRKHALSKFEQVKPGRKALTQRI